MTDYDYIICGGGMAGLSLAYYLKNSKLADKSVLIIESEEKNKNDRTWAFWEKEEGIFEHILHRKWSTVQLVDARGNTIIPDMGGYCYKLLRGQDFYAFMTAELKTHSGVTWLKDKVVHIDGQNGHATVTTQSGRILTAGLVFDSISRLNLSQKFNHNLLQHFKGYVIQTAAAVFNPEVPVMMDFSIAQKGDCRFMYIMPFDAQTALIEYTVFSETTLPPQDYDTALKEWIAGKWPQTSYRIIEEEQGVIPMSDVATDEFPAAHVVRIGTAGGYTNPATGYTFMNTQKRLRKLVTNLEQTGQPGRTITIAAKRFGFYASVLLNVLQQKRYPAADIFADLYRTNPAARVFSFLDGETHPGEELRLMNTVPKLPFIAATWAVLLRKLRGWLSGQPRPSQYQ